MSRSSTNPGDIVYHALHSLFPTPLIFVRIITPSNDLALPPIEDKIRQSIKPCQASQGALAECCISRLYCLYRSTILCHYSVSIRRTLVCVLQNTIHCTYKCSIQAAVHSTIPLSRTPSVWHFLNSICCNCRLKAISITKVCSGLFLHIYNLSVCLTNPIYTHRYL